FPLIFRSFTYRLSARRDAPSSPMNTRIDVALILWNPDVIQLVSFVLLHRNLRSRGVEPSRGAEEIQDLIASCGPTVVVFDLKPPYDESNRTTRSEEHTSELQSRGHLVCRLLLEKKKHKV